MHLVHGAVADHNEKGSEFAARCPYERNAGVVCDRTDGARAVELMNFGAVRIAGPDRNHRLICDCAEDLQALRSFQHNRLCQANRCAGRTIVALGLIEGGDDVFGLWVDQVSFSLEHRGRSIGTDDRCRQLRPGSGNGCATKNKIQTNGGVFFTEGRPTYAALLNAGIGFRKMKRLGPPRHR